MEALGYDFRGGGTLTEIYTPYVEGTEGQPSEGQRTNELDMRSMFLSQLSFAYLAADQLDDTRQRVRNWDTKGERAALDELAAAIGGIPTATIMGYSTAPVIDAFRAFHSHMQQRQSKLGDESAFVAEYERGRFVENRKNAFLEGTQLPWWMELGIGVASAFHPALLVADVLLTARDILLFQDPVALIGFGLGTAFDAIPAFRRLLRNTDEVMDAALDMNHLPHMQSGIRDRVDDIELSSTDMSANLRGEVRPVEPIEIRFSTSEEAVEYLRETYNVEADLTGMHNRNINILTSEIDHLVTEDEIYSQVFPIMQEELPSIQIRTSGTPPAEPDVYMPTGGGTWFDANGNLIIEFDLGKFAQKAPVSVMTLQEAAADTIQRMRRNVPESFDVYNIAAAIRHEFAHPLDAFIRTRLPAEIRPPINGRYTRGSIGEFLGENRGILQSLSPSSFSAVYPEHKVIGELFAESFTALRYLPDNIEKFMSRELLDNYLENFNKLVTEVVNDYGTKFPQNFPYEAHREIGGN